MIKGNTKTITVQRRQEKKEKAQRTEDKSKTKSEMGDVITNI